VICSASSALEERLSRAFTQEATEMAKESARGSTKLWQRVFEKDAPTHEELTKAVAAAGESYRVLRWWKYGQPAIDRITATLDVGFQDAGQVIQNIINAHGKEIQVNLDVFPYGIPNPEGVRIDVVFERQVQQ